jgi:hypothetical protein
MRVVRSLLPQGLDATVRLLIEIAVGEIADIEAMAALAATEFGPPLGVKAELVSTGDLPRDMLQQWSATKPVPRQYGFPKPGELRALPRIYEVVLLFGSTSHE